MSIFGGSGVEDSVEEGIEELKQRSDDVEVDDLRSPRELIDQVDRLEEIVEGLRERQQRMSENHLEDIQEIEFGEVPLEDGSLSSIEKLEGRLSRLESSVEKLEEGLEIDMNQMRDEIVDEAVEHEAIRFQQLKQRVDDIENQLRDAEIEEKVDESQLEEEIDDLKDVFEERLSEDRQELRMELEEDEARLIGSEEEVKIVDKNDVAKISNRVDRLEKRIEENESKPEVHVDEKVDREEFEQLKSHVEEVSELLKHIAKN
jgi:hypothetical protein